MLASPNPKARLRPARAGAVSPRSACAQLCITNRPARRPRRCRPYLSFQLQNYFHTFPHSHSPIIHAKARVSASLPRPASGPQTRENIKNPKLRIIPPSRSASLPRPASGPAAGLGLSNHPSAQHLFYSLNLSAILERFISKRATRDGGL